MGLRFRKSIRLFKGCKLNIGKSSVGISLGHKGLHLSSNARTGTRINVSAPGTGLSYSQKISSAPVNDMDLVHQQRKACSKCGRTCLAVAIFCPHCGSSLFKDIDNHTAQNSIAPQLYPAPDSNFDREHAKRIDENVPLFYTSVSAQIINWPCICACCEQDLGFVPGAIRIANSDLFYARIASNSMNWSLLYCDDCRTHIALAEQSKVTIKSSCFYSIGSYVAAPFVWFIALVFFWISTSSFSAGFSASTALTVGMIIAASFKAKNENEQSERNKKSLLRQAEEHYVPQCCSIWPAIVYKGSSGHIHSFGFRNGSYHSLFNRCNHDKIVY